MQERRSLTEHEKALVQAIVAALKPLLTEIERKLDDLERKADAILAQQRQTRPKPPATAQPCTHAQPCNPGDRPCRESRP